MKDIRILLASPDPSRLSAFVEGLDDTARVMVTREKTGMEAISRVREAGPENRPHLVVFDDNLPDGSGLKLTEALLEVDAMVHVALVSDMPRDEFHEQTEGLGILSSIPSTSGPKEAKALVKQLCDVLWPGSEPVENP